MFPHFFASDGLSGGTLLSASHFMLNFFKRTAAPTSADHNATTSASSPIIAIPATASPTARQQVERAIAHDRTCTMTIGEAQDQFRRHLRRPLSKRSLQRYCQNGVIDAQLISHSQGKEWLLNESSLTAFILKYPITFSDGAEPTEAMPAHRLAPQPPDPMPASVGAVAEASNVVVPTPGPADDDFAPATEVGEARRIGDLLIENARLMAIIEGKKELIDRLQLHDDRMHAQLTRAQALTEKLTDDVTNVSARMLDTMQKMATARYMLPPTDDGGLRAHGADRP